MHLGLEDGLHQHVVHAHLLGDVVVALLLVRRQQRDEALVLSLNPCLFEGSPDLGSRGGSVTAWHAEVHQNKAVNWFALFKSSFYQLDCFGTIATEFAIEIELHDQGLDGHNVEGAVVHDENLDEVRVVVVLEQLSVIELLVQNARHFPA